MAIAPAHRPGAKDSMGLTTPPPNADPGRRTELPATAVPAGPARAAADPPAALRAAPPLRILVEELRTALVEQLGPIEPPPLPAAGEEAGNVAAALVRWLSSVALAASMPLPALRAAVELAVERTRVALAHDAAAPPDAQLARAHEVLRASLATARGPEPPIYRGDLALVAGPRRLRARSAARRPARGGHEEPEATEEDVPGEGPAPDPRLPDLTGPMELVRRFTEDLVSALPGIAAQHFVFPAGLWDGRRWQGFADATLLGAHHERLRAELAARGIARERVLLLRAEPVAAGVVIVHARTARESASGALLEEVETAVTAVRTAHGWRIAALLASGDAG
jgi:hypothetical protein